MNNLSNAVEAWKLADFLNKVDRDYIPTLQERGMNISEYAKKLSNMSTICYEENAGRIIALVAGYTNNICNNTSFITIVGCLKEYRRQGITKSLMEDYLKICRKFGIATARTTTSKKNAQAQSFYEKCGFVRYDGFLEWGEPEKMHYKYVLL